MKRFLVPLICTALSLLFSDSVVAGDVKTGEGLFSSKGCVACHSIDGTARIGPSMKGFAGRKVKVKEETNVKEVVSDEAYFKRSIEDPDGQVVDGFQPGMMRLAFQLSNEEIAHLYSYVGSLGGNGATIEVAAKPVTLSPEEMESAKGIYFQRCAGCHGTTRLGATGPALLPDKRTKSIGTAGLKAILEGGLPGGMPPFRNDGILTDAEVDLMARFVQVDPPTAPEMSLAQMKDSWKVFVKPEDRPAKPQTKRNFENYMGVILRDAGKVAILDGDTHELVNVVNTGYAVHILRSSASGRYFYSIGRDGLLTMIDLYMEKPDKVAEIKTAYDARSVESSKAPGFEDKLLAVGGYWPPSLVFLDGQTLEPKKIVSTSGYTQDTNEFIREARVAAIVAAHKDPVWIVNIKETGHIWLVDYRDINNLKIESIKSERFLHDGGWESEKRYILMAANARDTIAVVDTQEKKLASLIKVGNRPHPGRGMNMKHATFGPVWITGHLGDETLRAIGTDPKGHPDNAWKVVATMKAPGAGGGNLFVKSHPASKWIFSDRTLNPDSKLYRSVAVFDKEKLEFNKLLTIPDEFPDAKAVHLEFNKSGSEVWVSAWAPKNKPSAILVFDSTSLELKKVIKGDWVITPTGHFNMYNTMHDIY